MIEKLNKLDLPCNDIEQWSRGRASANETVESSSIPGPVKSKIIKIGISSFSAKRSALKWTVRSLHRVR